MTKKKPMRAGVRKLTRRDSPTAATAKAALWKAVDRACRARGEALWTNGYRTACRRIPNSSEYGDPEEDRLYQKELAQLRACGDAEAKVTRALAAYTRALKAGK